MEGRGSTLTLSASRVAARPSSTGSESVSGAGGRLPRHSRKASGTSLGSAAPFAAASSLKSASRRERIRRSALRSHCATGATSASSTESSRARACSSTLSNVRSVCVPPVTRPGSNVESSLARTSRSSTATSACCASDAMQRRRAAGPARSSPAASALPASSSLLVPSRREMNAFERRWRGTRGSNEASVSSCSSLSSVPKSAVTDWRVGGGRGRDSAGPSFSSTGARRSRSALVSRSSAPRSTAPRVIERSIRSPSTECICGRGRG